MTEVKRGKVEEVDDQNQFCEEEISTNEEHDKCELEKIVEDEVASNSCSGLNVFGVFGE